MATLRCPGSMLAYGLVFSIIGGGATLRGQTGPFVPPGSDAQRVHPLKIELGRALFESTALSATDTVSCKTCHDPGLAFTDGKVDAEGILELGTGRNTPTLTAIGMIEHFRDPDQARLAVRTRTPKTLDLEERCLAPISNGLEMGDDLDAALGRLKKLPHMPQRFDRAFGGGGGVTKARVGKALASFVGTIEPPRTPYRAYLEGEQSALDSDERLGLAVFTGVGRCNACHCGPALTDGLMHVVDPPDGQRMQNRIREASRRRMELLRRDHAGRDPELLLRMTQEELAIEATRKAETLPGGGGYDPEQIEVQTTTLWDVARTGPWFRDGSATTLRIVVRQHVQELREVHFRRRSVGEALSAVRKVGKGSPKVLRPQYEIGSETVLPAELGPAELDAVLAFLHTLSPR